MREPIGWVLIDWVRILVAVSALWPMAALVLRDLRGSTRRAGYGLFGGCFAYAGVLVWLAITNRPDTMSAHVALDLVTVALFVALGGYVWSGQICDKEDCPNRRPPRRR